MSDDTALGENWGQQFDHLPPMADDRVAERRPSREKVVDWWDERFGIDPTVFDGYAFWEKGTGKIWAFHGEIVGPIEVEGLGTCILWTRQRHWKPSTDTAQRFCSDMTKNVTELSPSKVQAFADGRDQQFDRWEDGWNYLTAVHEIVGELGPLDVGLYLHGELRSTVPKGRQEDFVKPE